MALVISKAASGLVLANTSDFVCFSKLNRRLQSCSVVLGSSTGLLVAENYELSFPFPASHKNFELVSQST